jgi:hypothetical protein
MHVVVGLMFVALGGTCVGYLWAGGSIFDREPPMLVLGLSLIFLTAGLAGRVRAPALLARAGLGGALVGIAWTATRFLAGTEVEPTDTLMQRLYLVGILLGTAGVVALFLLIPKIDPARPFKLRLPDVVPVAGVAVVVGLGVLWLVADDARLRPCRLGNDAECDMVATRLIEAAEHASSRPPTRSEESAARLLDGRPCRTEAAQCAMRRYALGTVALRAGRFDTAREAFLRACEEDRNWCPRAAQHRSLPWTPDELARLERRR